MDWATVDCSGDFVIGVAEPVVAVAEVDGFGVVEEGGPADVVGLTTVVVGEPGLFGVVVPGIVVTGGGVVTVAVVGAAGTVAELGAAVVTGAGAVVGITGASWVTTGA